MGVALCNSTCNSRDLQKLHCIYGLRSIPAALTRLSAPRAAGGSPAPASGAAQSWHLASSNTPHPRRGVNWGSAYSASHNPRSEGVLL